MRKVAVALAAGMLWGSASLVMAADQNARDSKDRAPDGPSISTVARQRTANPGDLVDVDVFISNVSDLNTFQVALEVLGGGNGSLRLEDLKVQKDRKDFVFADHQVVSAEHLEGARMGATQIGSAVEVGRQAYLGTFHYRVGDDATGAFKVQVKMGKESFLRNSQGTAIAFLPGKAATVTVGEVGRDHVQTKEK